MINNGIHIYVHGKFLSISSKLLAQFIYFFFLFSFWPCRILVPCPGIQPPSPAVDVQSLNHWTAREVPSPIFPLF